LGNSDADLLTVLLNLVNWNKVQRNFGFVQLCCSTSLNAHYKNLFAACAPQGRHCHLSGCASIKNPSAVPSGPNRYPFASATTPIDASILSCA
jgi:hypothetical protein